MRPANGEVRGLVPAIEQINGNPKPVGRSSRGPREDRGGPEDLGYSRPQGITPPQQPPPFFRHAPLDATTQENRIEVGYDLGAMPGGITWLTLDGETYADKDFVGAQGGTDPDGDQLKMVPRKPSIDVIEWAKEHLDEDQARHLVAAVYTFLPSTKAGIPSNVTNKLWTHFMRIAVKREGDWLNLDTGELLHDFSSWMRAWYKGVVDDTYFLRDDQRKACGQKTLITAYTIGTKWHFGVARWRCKSWTCPHCSRRLQASTGRKLSTALVALTEARNDQAPMFLTLTLWPKALKARFPMLDRAALEVLSWRICRLQWVKFIRKMRDKWKSKESPLEYQIRIEAHKSGFAHLHAAIVSPALRAQMKTRAGAKYMRAWVKKTAVECGFGPIADFQAVKHPRDVGYYLTKAATMAAPGKIARELTKAAQTRSAMIPRGIRTLDASRGLYTLATLAGWTDPAPNPRDTIFVEDAEDGIGGDGVGGDGVGGDGVGGDGVEDRVYHMVGIGSLPVEAWIGHFIDEESHPLSAAAKPSLRMGRNWAVEWTDPGTSERDKTLEGINADYSLPG